MISLDNSEQKQAAPVPDAPARPIRATGAHLYLIRSETGAVKIGRSSNPRQRFLDLRCASASKMILVRIFRDRGGEERAIHEKLKKHRTRGEWFRDTLEFREQLSEALGVRLRFRQDAEITEEEERCNLENEERRREDHFQAYLDTTAAKIAREQADKAARRARNKMEAERKERRRIERRAIARDIATYDMPPNEGAENAK